MGDEADIGLVDAHSEGDGRRHHLSLATKEARLRWRIPTQPGI
jgi:hypothetical protein